MRNNQTMLTLVVALLVAFGLYLQWDQFVSYVALVFHTLVA